VGGRELLEFGAGLHCFSRKKKGAAGLRSEKASHRKHAGGYLETCREVDQRACARRFVLGFDSKFGRGREGTPERLRDWGFDVVVVPKVLVGDRPVSSTAIREAVELGDLDGAARMLGRPVAVYGDVVAGDARGRELGFRTANLDLHHELHPPPGVYAGRARIVRRGEDDTQEASRRFPAVANVGFRPTFGPSGEARGGAPLVEVHLLDFSGDLYGEHLELEFHAFLRAERRFPGLEALRAAITQDVERARALLR